MFRRCLTATDKHDRGHCRISASTTDRSSFTCRVLCIGYSEPIAFWKLALAVQKVGDGLVVIGIRFFHCGLLLQDIAQQRGFLSVLAP